MCTSIGTTTRRCFDPSLPNVEKLERIGKGQIRIGVEASSNTRRKGQVYGRGEARQPIRSARESRERSSAHRLLDGRTGLHAATGRERAVEKRGEGRRAEGRCRRSFDDKPLPPREGSCVFSAQNAAPFCSATRYRRTRCTRTGRQMTLQRPSPAGVMLYTGGRRKRTTLSTGGVMRMPRMNEGRYYTMSDPRLHASRIRAATYRILPPRHAPLSVTATGRAVRGGHLSWSPCDTRQATGVAWQASSYEPVEEICRRVDLDR